MDNYLVWRFLHSLRLARQTEELFRVEQNNRIEIHTLKSGGGIIATYYPGDRIPPPEVNMDILIVQDLIGASSSAVEIYPNPRIVAVGWYNLRHLIGPYFIGRREIGGHEVLIDTASKATVEKLPEK